MLEITFKLLEKPQVTLVKDWLKEDHVAEFWYGEGLKSTLRSIDRFVDGQEPLFTLWLAYDKEIPFAYLMTSPIKSLDELPFSKYLTAESKAMTLDLFIGEKAYLGKGLAHHLIQELIRQKFPDTTDTFIDPDVNNTRAIHVYEKAGFKKLEEFTPNWPPFQPSFLMRRTNKPR